MKSIKRIHAYISKLLGDRLFCSIIFGVLWGLAAINPAQSNQSFKTYIGYIVLNSFIQEFYRTNDESKTNKQISELQKQIDRLEKK